MADGSTKPIAEVEIGDKVKATNPTTGETIDREVIDTIVHTDEGDMTKLTVTADDGTTGTVDATSWHPVWVDTEGRFVDIGELEPGQSLVSADGSTPTVTGVDRYTHFEPVYDLTVEGVHTYYVVISGSNLLVHNCDSPWMDSTGLGHVRNGHVRGGKYNDPTKSTFKKGSTGEDFTDEEFFDMVDAAADVEGRKQDNNGRCARVCTARDFIGVDQSGLPTKEYTVISEMNGRVVTMHPGRPN
jgi:hypothetical protein